MEVAPSSTTRFVERRIFACCIHSHYDRASTSIKQLGKRIAKKLGIMPQAEVIQEWSDFDSAGCTFERGRMEKNVQDICFKRPAGVPEALKDPRHGVKLKQADIQALVRDCTSADLRTLTNRRMSSFCPRTWPSRRSSPPVAIWPRRPVP